MTSWTGLSAVVLAAVLGLATPGLADHRSGVEDPVTPETDAPAASPRMPDPSGPGDEPRPGDRRAPNGDRGISRPGPALPNGEQEITGRVLELDRESGGLLLATPMGVIALQGPPEALRDVHVGDLVRVRVAMGGDEDSTL